VKTNKLNSDYREDLGGEGLTHDPLHENVRQLDMTGGTNGVASY